MICLNVVMKITATLGQGSSTLQARLIAGSRSLRTELLTRENIANFNSVKAEIRLNFTQIIFRNKVKNVMKPRHSEFHVEIANG